MKHLTIHNLPAEVAEALEQERHRSGDSLNRTVIRLLGRALGVAPKAETTNGLARFAGTWTEEEHRRFEEAVAVTASALREAPEGRRHTAWGASPRIPDLP